MLLNVASLCTHIHQNGQAFPLLEHINFTLNPGERLGVVGESGCGKSMMALSIMGLLPDHIKSIGHISFNNIHQTENKDSLLINKKQSINLLQLSDAQMCQIRGNRIGMIFQEPMTALNPVLSIGDQVSESLKLHFSMNRKEAHLETMKLLERVGLPNSRFPLSLFPHQLSGGQRQRVVIAMAIACEPDLLIADEPTTALDVTIQKQILELLDELVSENNMALILITHDLGVVAENTDQMLVMYAGKVVEKGPTDQIFEYMMHPYTQALFESIPRIQHDQMEEKEKFRFHTIPGRVPDFREKQSGCVFSTRCPKSQSQCFEKTPEEIPSGWGHHSACFFSEESLA